MLLGGEYEVVKALQLSEGGMLISTSRKRALRSNIVLTLLLPGGSCVIARAMLIYDNQSTDSDFQYGVKFLDLDIPRRRLIRSYVTAKTQQEAENEKADPLN